MKYKIFNLLWLLSIAISLKAQTVQTPKAVIADFMDQRFGMFIHWGPITLRGTEIGWSRNNEVPAAEYDVLYKKFDAKLFDADKWVLTAKNAGMKYLTITSKHHDGFCLWPTKFSDYNVMNSPLKKDVVGELAKACKKYKIKFCVYFTVLDWRDPNYTQQKGPEGAKVKTDMRQFVNTMKGELQEIIENYHPYMLWFDGNWESQWTNDYGTEVFNHIKKLSPNVIINNRLQRRYDGEHHANLIPGSVGDYATPEQEIGALNMTTPWETCMTIATQWAWKPNDKTKSLKECIQTLARTSAGNGNLLFNVGPKPDGEIEPEQVSRLQEMGDWLKIYGESIYSTKGGPFKPGTNYASTRKGKALYIHVFEKQTTLKLNGLTGFKVKKAAFINGKPVKYQQNEAGELILNLPAELPNENDSVIKLELDKNAELIPIVS
ncbi:MAG: alpha-L-fucosidase [Bacteroidota bacterium]